MQSINYSFILEVKSDGSRDLLEHLSVIFYNLSIYSNAFVFFCKKIMKKFNFFCFNEDLSTFIDIYEIWIQKLKASTHTTYEDFIQSTEGINKFYVSLKNKNKRQKNYCQQYAKNINVYIYVVCATF